MNTTNVPTPHANVSEHATVASHAMPAFDIGMVWMSINAMKSLIDQTSGDPVAELRAGLARHAGGDHGDLTDEEAYETPGKVRSVYGSELEIETDLATGVTYIG